MYVAADIAGETQFESIVDAITSTGAVDAVVVQYNHNGEAKWVSQFGGYIPNGVSTSVTHIQAIVTGLNGITYVGGYFTGHVNSSTATGTTCTGISSTAQNMWFAAVDTNGKCLWLKGAPDGAFYQGGIQNMAFDFADATLNAVAGGGTLASNTEVFQFDVNGDMKWKASVNNVGEATTLAYVTVDENNGHVYSLTPFGVVSQHEATTGNVLWSKAISDDPSVRVIAQGLSANSAGGKVVAAVTHFNVVVFDSYLHQFDSNGATSGLVHLPSFSVSSLYLDMAENIVAGGYASGDLTVESITFPLPYQGNPTKLLTVLKFTPQMAIAIANFADDVNATLNYNLPVTVAMGGNGESFVGGTFKAGTINFLSSSVTSQGTGGDNLFVNAIQTYCPLGSEPYFDGCVPCHAGEGNLRSTTSSCVPCAAGTFRGETNPKDPATFTCQNCQPGSVPSADHTKCVLCQPGYYQSNAGQATCLPCEGNSIAASAGTATCTECKGFIGLFADDSHTVCDFRGSKDAGLEFWTLVILFGVCVCCSFAIIASCGLALTGVIFYAFVMAKKPVTNSDEYVPIAGSSKLAGKPRSKRYDLIDDPQGGYGRL